MRKKKTTILRELIEDEKILLRPGVAVALHARLAQEAGFKAVGISGANAAAYLLGLPDAGLITMTEMAENARRVPSAVDSPVMAKWDSSASNASNMRPTVAEMIRGVPDGLFLEAQVG